MANSNHSYIHYLFLCYFVLLNFFVEYTSAEDSFCGIAAPDAEKLCISIRLPWQLEPIYFCTDKDQIKYRSNCQLHYEGRCENRKTNNDDLLIATPWDCCPVTSPPDYCTKYGSHDRCSPQPFNRTCIITNSTSHVMDHPIENECCPNYFCEAETQPENCKYKMLHPECMQPQNKTNCIAFVDKHGCCNKYQCDEDEVKPGTCPQDSHPYYAPAPSSVYEFTTESGVVFDVNVTGTEESSGSSTNDGSMGMATDSSTVSPSRVNQRSYPADSRMTTYPSRFPYNNHQLSCIGDFTCPGVQKCCPEMFSKLDGKYPVHGFCTQPVESSTVSSAM